jgi:uncharacterized protein (DUF433 family)
MVLPEFMETDDDGEIRLRGHRIRLIDVAARFEEGHSAEAIVLDHYPTLGLPLVYKTIAFHLEHEDEVRRLITENTARMERLMAVPRTTPALAQLRERMANLQRAEAH